MYLDFFKFKKNPFHITPDPEFLFLSPSHNEALTSITDGIEERKGLVAVTGEVGVGKTTILRSYLEGTDPARIRIVYIFNAALSFGRLIRQIVSELGIVAVDKDLSGLIDSLFHYLIDEYKNDRRVVLIIDEAQNLPVETLERFRMLSDRETSQKKLLQIILVGQTEFENKLNLPELRELKQRIASSCRIDTLQPDESIAYIQHRLMKASSFHNPVFTKEAVKRIVNEARGIPRRINVICDNALITAFGYRRKSVDDKIVKEVIKDLRGGQKRVAFRWRFVLVPAMAVVLGLVTLTSVTLLTPKDIPSVRKEVFSAKVPEPPSAAEIVTKHGLTPPVGSARKAEPESSTSEAPATGSDKSFAEIAPEVPVQPEIPGDTQAHAAEKASVPSDESASVQGGIASVEVVKKQEVTPPVGSARKAEPEPPAFDAPATGGDKSFDEIVPEALVQSEIPGDTQAHAAEKASVPSDESASAQGGIASVEVVKKQEVTPSVGSARNIEPEPPTFDAPATGGDKSFAEIAPEAPVQWQVPGNTQAHAAEKASVPNDEGASAQGGIANGPKPQSYRYMIRVGTFVDREKAEEIKNRIEANGYNAAVKTLRHQGFGKVFVVQLQPVNSVSRAATLRTLLSCEIEGEPKIIKVPSR